ncbi:hypothetical protein CI109_103992 [Kwoniella shandongensis]|uniref:Uncharacterized protein n=1 Tax=Kwoniella shandongensis TaxID=1734106 RepID=A0A5M6BXM3_9TREE|nr:uncharacterized protein CI109_004123 [Kwoniella shandongensis]KAA5527584.1 hypothetical protein CI109_004123 [Kwoniella shandongensis]
MSAFFEMNDNRFKNLEEKNRTLHNENCALRNELTDVRDEIGILRRGIENVRTNDRIPSSTEREGDGLTNARENIFTESPPIRPPLRPLYNFNTRNFDSRTAISDPPSPRTSRNALPDISTASAATDNFGGVTPRAAADLARHAQAGSVLTPSFGSHQSYADWAFGRLSGLSSASLDEVIDRLRSAIVGLAAGMDTMERRNEVRTMTESLRVLEEVGSLRAIVTTMRMQVMMERPSRRPSLQFSHSASSVRSNNQDPHHFTGHQDADSTGDNDSLEDENRAPSVRESIVFTPLGRTDSSARSSTSSLVTSQAVAGRSVGRSGAGLTGRSVGIPLEEEVGGANTGHNGRRGSRLSRANPVNLIRKQPSRLGSGAARL